MKILLLFAFDRSPMAILRFPGRSRRKIHTLEIQVAAQSDEEVPL